MITDPALIRRGDGVAIRGDAVQLVASLPDQGDIAFRVTSRQGAALNGQYDLAV